jgi:hypothetical protein
MAGDSERVMTMGILLQQPALPINAHDVGWPSYDVWRTLEAPESTTAGTAAGWIFATNMEEGTF